MVDSTDGSLIEVILLAVTFTGLIIVIVGAFIICHLRRNARSKNEETTKKCIYPYLQKFEVDDIDIRRAPTGGWHGTYVNKLAYGINEFQSICEDSDDSSKNTFISYDDEYNDDEDNNDIENGTQKRLIIDRDDGRRRDFEKRNSSLTHSSVVRDCLFTDATESIPYYGLSVVEDSIQLRDDVRPWRMVEDTI
mmetsp:Transcript_36535/g.39623  ORF Transcript_36535/g.39623 Transcript_36535/m.39623 type:complete len:193 (-) Transcript_36535:147-725(-)